MSYTINALKGVGWTGSYRLTSRILAFIRIGALARILTPFQFGTVGIATLVLSFLETFSQLGLGVFFIQEKKPIEKYISTAWVLSILRGIFIFLLLFLFSGFIASFFNSIESELLIKLVALVALVRGFISPSRVSLLKNMNFKGETIFSFAVLLVDFSFTVILAIILKNPISIVYGLLFGAITEVALSLILLKPRPRFKFNTKHFKTITNRGKWVTASNIFNYLFSEGDDILVGKLFKNDSLGIYQVSYKISTLPLTEISQVFNTVAFPIFSKFADDKKRLMRAFKRFFYSILIIVIPIGLAIYFFPNIIVSILLGVQWSKAIPIIKTMAAFGVIRSLTVIFNPLFNSLKLQKYVTYYNYISLIVMGLLIYPLTINFGLIGIVYSVLIGSITSLLLSIYYAVNIFR